MIPQNVIIISSANTDTNIILILNGADITFNIPLYQIYKLSQYEYSIPLMHFLLVNLDFEAEELTMDNYDFFISRIQKKQSPVHPQAEQVVHSLQSIINQVILGSKKGSKIIIPTILHTGSVMNFQILEQDYITLDKIKHICPLKDILQLDYKMNVMPYYFL